MTINKTEAICHIPIDWGSLRDEKGVACWRDVNLIGDCLKCAIIVISDVALIVEVEDEDHLLILLGESSFDFLVVEQVETNAAFHVV